jgi:hypothetical protein
MFDVKHPLKSIGVMAPLVSLVFAIINHFKPGLGVTSEDVGQILEQVDIVLGLCLAAYGRWNATKQISLSAPLTKSDTPSTPAAALALLVLLPLTLSACAAPGGQGVAQLSGGSNATDPAYQLLVTCRAWDTTLRSLAGYRAQGKLTADQVATVDQWRPTLNYACSSGDVNPATSLDAAEKALQQMVLIDQSAAAK